MSSSLLRRAAPRPPSLCRWLPLTFVALTVLGSLCLPGGASAQTGSLDEMARQRREAFLKAREEMRTIPPPAATPRPAAKPTPAPAPTVAPPPTFTPPPPPTATPPPAATATPRTGRATPVPAPTPVPGNTRPDEEASVVVEKYGGRNEENTDYPPPPPRKRFFFGLFSSAPTYRYLSRSVLDQIDGAHVRANRWKYIVVHNSGTRQGNARVFDFYHRHTRHMPNGMAYHFVIGNGTSTGDGQIEIGSRWTRQINGGHVHSDYLNNIALGICLVGDYNRDVPTRNQYAALDELITYLRKRVGRVERRLSIVKAHREINPVPTDCPGDRFSYAWLHRKFD